MCYAALRGDLAAFRSLVEEQGQDVNEKDEVRSLWDYDAINGLTQTSHMNMHVCECTRVDTLHWYGLQRKVVYQWLNIW